MTRRYGKAPFRAAAIHGGPGAVGSAGGLAEGLAVSASCGVLEPFQSKETIPELEAELEKQLAAEAAAPVALIGHSWGAWLAALFAAEHPERVSKLILVGSGPLHSRYVPLIGERRLARLDGRRRERFQALLAELDSPDAIDRDALLAEFGALCTASDVYAPADPPLPRTAFSLRRPDVCARLGRGRRTAGKRRTAPAFFGAADSGDGHSWRG